MSETIHEWKKVELKRNIVNRSDTNFDKEIERINHYLQRNEESIDKYVNHQKLLVEMDLWKKMKAKSLFEKEKSATANTEEWVDYA